MIETHLARANLEWAMHLGPGADLRMVSRRQVPRHEPRNSIKLLTIGKAHSTVMSALSPTADGGCADVLARSMLAWQLRGKFGQRHAKKICQLANISHLS